MNRILLLAIAFVITTASYAQSPQGFNYQAVVRNAQGSPLADQQVSYRFTVIDTKNGDNSVYSETGTISTNSLGLINVIVGNGTPESGEFSAIDWSTGEYSMQVEMDETGGSTYQNIGTSVLSSVPFALYANQAGNVFSGEFDSLSNVPVNLDTNGTDDLLKPATAETNDFISFDGSNWVAKSISIGNTGGQQAFSNMQPFLGINYIIALQGIFPSRNSIANPTLAEVMIFASNFAPRGWALCEGQLLPISQNTALFSLLGTIYGGDGRTTFGLPDLRGRVPVGVGNGPGLPIIKLGEKGGSATTTLNINYLPNHNHQVIIED